jgi:hypothetical protein
MHWEAWVRVRQGQSFRRYDRGSGAPAVEFAWRVHTALESGTAKVDMKASILLAFQGGGFIFVTTSREEIVSTTSRLPALFVAAGILLLVSAMGCAATAILPALGSARGHRENYVNEWIYFGHVRLWEAADLAARLGRLTERDEVAALCAQLVRMSRLNWRKHRLLQSSVLLTLLCLAVMMGAVAIRTRT